MNKKFIISAVLLLSGLGFSVAQQTPANTQNETITFVGATVHTGNGTVIENAKLIFKAGKITALGQNELPNQGRIIDVAGQHIYPGIIAPVSTLGLVEIDAIRQSRDDDELGEFGPNIRSLIAYNAESQVVESMRPNGVLLAQITPQGGVFSGSSSIVQLDAWNWEDAAIKTDDGVHLNWPNTYRRGRWWLGEDRGWKPNKNYDQQLKAITDYLDRAAAYSTENPAVPNEALKALVGTLDGSKTIYVYADGVREIMDAVSELKSHGAQNVVIVGGYQADQIIPFLKRHMIPVLLDRVHALPQQADDDYDKPYRLPGILKKGGLLVGLNARGSMERMSTRNLPFYAGHAAGFGLNPEEALELITSNTAKIIGVDDQYGSLEVGKSATFFVSRGDALDMRTNQLSHAFIDGREISLETHQTELYKRYSNKYGQKPK